MYGDEKDRIDKFESIKNEYKIDQVINVKAWWRKKIKTKCRIYNIDKYFVTVIPMEGNPHTRVISILDFLDIMKE